MSNPIRVWCVVPAAGVGRRMGGQTPKQYLLVPGSSRKVIDITLKRLINIDCIEKIVVSIGVEDDYWSSLDIATHSKIETAVGGEERCHSVLSGLNKLKQWAEDDDWVLVHDVARPCIRVQDIERLIDEVSRSSEGGLLGYPVRDTMKRTDASRKITDTVDRNDLWHALTPQMFRLGSLIEAIQSSLDSGVIVTDEASAIERLGIAPIMVEGASDNIKITRPDDLILASLYLKNQISESH